MTSSFKNFSSPISTQGGNASLKAKLKAFVSLLAFLMLGFVASTRPLAAQAINVTTADDLNAAIGTVNTGAAAATLQFNSNSVDLATLTSSLGTFHFDTTLLDGTGTHILRITNSTFGATASLNSKAAFILSPNYAVSILGAGSFGQDSNGNGLAGNAASLTAGSLDLTLYAALNVDGGDGSYSSSVAGANGGNGGNAAIAVSGSVSMDSSDVTVQGGAGGYSYYANGGNGGNGLFTVGSNLTLTSNNDTAELNVDGSEGGYNDDDDYNVGGSGGAATLMVSGAVSLDSAYGYVDGGSGNYGYGLAGQTEGSGGNAYASMASLTLTSNNYYTGNFNGDEAYFEVGAGSGAADYHYANGGNGGNATLATTGGVTVDSAEVTVYGGEGGYSYTNAGNGGNALLSVGSNLTLTSTNTTGELGITGGEGGESDEYTGYATGNGGTASLLVSGAVSMDSAGTTITGGEGGYGGYSIGGNGGNAWVSMGSLTLTSNNYYTGNNNGTYAYFEEYGGEGGGGDYANGGNAGNGTLLSAGAVSVDSAGLDVEGGEGGYSYYANGGNGGNALVAVNSNLTLTSTNDNFELYVDGGEGGYNDDDAYAVGGNGGAATLTVSGAVSMDSGEGYVDGGSADYGYGSGSETEGSGGNAYASMASLSLTSENYYNGNGNGEYGYFEVAGGTGGYDYYIGNAGNGGNASLYTSGAVSVDSAELEVYGGDGAYSYGANGGNGGNALLSAGNLTLTSTYDTGELYVYGGYGDGDYDDYGLGLTGNGGNATFTAKAVSIDSSEAYVYGGDSGYYYDGYGLIGTTDGSGGNALVSISSLSLTSDNYYTGNNNGTYAYFEEYGGAGGTDHDYANGGNGGNATFLSSGAVSVDSAEVTISGGEGGSAYYANGGNGGNALLAVNSNLTLTSANDNFELYVYGGEGGANYDDSYGVGGSGGAATLMVSGAVSMDSGEGYVDGGSADYGYGHTGQTEGSGGNAYASMASLTLTSNNYYNGNNNGQYGYFEVGGGNGGYDYYIANGGNGGNASLYTSGAVSVDSAELEVYGGNGVYTYGGNGGSGGNALLSVGSNLTLTSTYDTSDLYVTGGEGDANYDDESAGVAGNGGNATLTAKAVSMDASDAYVEGGDVDYDYDYGYGKFGTTEGSGGNGLVSVNNLTLTTGSDLYVEGGSGGDDYSVGNGGNGGNGTLTVAGTLSMDGGSYIEIDGGSAGYNDHEYANGGNGGNAVLTANSVVMNHSSGIYLDAGEGEYGETYGNDGNALVNINSLNLVDSGSYLDVYGGDYSGLGGAANVTIGSLNGAGSVYVYSYDTNGNLAVSNGNFSGVISGDEVLEKVGTGTLTLTGTNTYSGGTSVLSGTLAVGSTGALSTGDVAVEGGFLATSGGPSTLTVAGNYTEGPAGTLQLGLAGSAVGQYDTLSVSGAATLGGSLELTSYNSFIPSAGQTYAMVNTVGTLNGQFAAVGDTFFQPLTVVYTANQVDVTTGAFNFAQLGSTSNDASIGAALDALAKSGSGIDPALSFALTSASNAQLQKLFNEISPANLTPLYQMGFSLNDAQSTALIQHLAGLWGGAGFGTSDYSWNNKGTLFAANIPASDEASMANNAQPDRWGVFVNGIGSFGSVTGTSNAPGYQFSLGGTTAGVDYRFSKDLVGGVLLGYSSSGTSESTGSVNQTGGQLGLYGGWKQDALHVEALAEGGINSYTTQRNTFGGSATGSTQGLQLSGQLGAGYDFKTDDMKWGPFVTGQFTNVSMDAFQESGSLAPLSYGAQNESSLITDLGAQASKSWDMGGGFILTPQLSAAWEHLYQGNLDSLSANFGTSTSGFSVNGPDMGTDGLAIGVGVNGEFAKGFNAYLQYNGVLAITNYDSQDFGAGLNIGF